MIVLVVNLEHQKRCIIHDCAIGQGKNVILDYHSLLVYCTIDEDIN